MSKPATQSQELRIASYWSVPAAELFTRVGSRPRGLASHEAAARHAQAPLAPAHASSPLALLGHQFENPIILILFAAAALAFLLGQRTDALIILAIVGGSGWLGFWQERGAANAVEALLARVRVKANVLRDGREVELPIEQIVPGDVIVLNAGDVIPGDCRVLEANNFFLDEAILTGETYPVAKTPGILPTDTPLAARKNALFAGTHVVSGTAQALVVAAGKGTEFGRVSQRLALARGETEFEHGVRHFGYLLMEVTLLLVLVIFGINVLLGRPVLDSFLFTLALAVGLTPQLLPVIISVNLAHGASQMAQRRVIVKRLASIENFGSMNVLCADKTGTLTEGAVRLQDALDLEGRPSERVLLYACLNAALESGFVNPLDAAILSHPRPDLSGYEKLGEVPYDFVRKRLSIAVSKGGGQWMITKGDVPSVIAACTQAELAGGRVVELATVRADIERRYQEFGALGQRTLGVAYRLLEPHAPFGQEQETDCTFLGFLVFHDPLKRGINDTIGALGALGISLKILSGDNRHVAATVARMVGMAHPVVLTGSLLRGMSNEALVQRSGSVDVFAEVEPMHKERILLALRKAGNVVGFVGDGINDASALHAADVGISVDQAADVAKQAADIVLLEKDLGVLVAGVREGRKTFANTLKYVYIATSANFGNMMSMACVSLFLPFLPLLPKQILLTNLLTDLPEMAIATDSVDAALVERPRRWEIGQIRAFMIVFGALSSIFDFATFAVLLGLLRANRLQFRTGWFVESVISASAVVLVIRTRQPFFRSMPGRALLWSTIGVACATLAIPYTALGSLLGLEPLPLLVLAALAAIVAAYVGAAELVKGVFYRSERPGRASAWRGARSFEAASASPPD